MNRPSELVRAVEDAAVGKYTQVRKSTEETYQQVQVSLEELKTKASEYLKKGQLRRIVLKDEVGSEVAAFPFVGVAVTVVGMAVGLALRGRLGIVVTGITSILAAVGTATGYTINIETTELSRDPADNAADAKG